MTKACLVAVLGVVLAGNMCMAQDQTPIPEWRLAVQTWTFNKMTVFDALDTLQKIGVKYVELYPGQKLGGGLAGGFGPEMDSATRDRIKAKLKACGIKLVNFGVTGAKGEAGWRTLMAFAKDMGIETIVAEPPEKDLEMIDKLCNEYGINVAIHNHPKPSHYWDPSILLNAAKGRSTRIGACADTGHWPRSGLDPIQCLKQCEGRIVSLHMKDLKMPEKYDMPWGTGDNKAAKMLAELKRQKFRGVFSIEYERTTPELVENVKKCVDFFNTCAALSQQELEALPDKQAL
jgi:sugar phosphate isomerase/epimerase